MKNIGNPNILYENILEAIMGYGRNIDVNDKIK